MKDLEKEEIKADVCLDMNIGYFSQYMFFLPSPHKGKCQIQVISLYNMNALKYVVGQNLILRDAT